jgi:hypothetical protein
LITGKEATKVAMFSWEFQEWGQSHISREEDSTIREPLSPSVLSPTLHPPPSHPPSECKADSALPSRLAEDPGAPQQRLERTRGSGDARSGVTDRPDSERAALLQGSNSSGSEPGSGVTSQQGITGAIFGTIATVPNLLATSSSRPITPPFSAEPTASVLRSSTGPEGPPSSVGSIAPATVAASNPSDVLSWTSQDPRQSQLFNPWGIV